MKKLLVFFLMLPTVAWGMNCKNVYDTAYKFMTYRQSGVPMPIMMEGVDQAVEESKGRHSPKELERRHNFLQDMVEMAYRMPNMGFMQSAAHTMAVEFANVQYLKCTRINRK